MGIDVKRRYQIYKRVINQTTRRVVLFNIVLLMVVLSMFPSTREEMRTMLLFVSIDTIIFLACMSYYENKCKYYIKEFAKRTVKNNK